MKSLMFQGPMVLSIRDGLKTMTRRVLNPQPLDMIVGQAPWASRALRVLDGKKCWCAKYEDNPPRGKMVYSRLQPGDLVMVKERLELRDFWCYAADGARVELEVGQPGVRDFIEWGMRRQADGRAVWSPMLMPEWAGRHFIRITDSRPERVTSISVKDAKAEGLRSFTKDGRLQKWWACDPFDGPIKCAWQDLPTDPREAFRELWQHTHGPGTFTRDTWVWAYTFEKASKSGKEEQEAA